jgi:ubiquinone/menaquinone biosynthesis C-methylase UbiE
MIEYRQEHYWSRLAESYDRKGEYVVGKRILNAIRTNLMEDQSLGNAIEFGCGTGFFTKSIAKNAKHIIATDLSDEMLEIARVQLGKFKNITIEKMDCANTSLTAGSFDSVIMVNLIHVIDDPMQCLQESYRVLRDGGILIVVDFTAYKMNFYKKIKLIFRYLREWGLPPRQGNNNMSPDELVSQVENVGFRVMDVRLLEDGSNAIYLKCEKS